MCSHSWVFMFLFLFLSFYFGRAGLCKVTFCYILFSVCFMVKGKGQVLFYFFQFVSSLLYFCFDCGLLLRRFIFSPFGPTIVSYLKDLGGPFLDQTFPFLLFPVCSYGLYLLGTGGMAFFLPFLPFLPLRL